MCGGEETRGRGEVQQLAATAAPFIPHGAPVAAALLPLAAAEGVEVNSLELALSSSQRRDTWLVASAQHQVLFLFSAYLHRNFISSCNVDTK